MLREASDTISLYNGIKIPCIGLGTWQAVPDINILDKSTEAAVLSALSCGLPHQLR